MKYHLLQIDKNTKSAIRIVRPVHALLTLEYIFTIYNEEWKGKLGILEWNHYIPKQLVRLGSNLTIEKRKSCVRCSDNECSQRLYTYVVGLTDDQFNCTGQFKNNMLKNNCNYFPFCELFSIPLQPN